MNCALSYYSYRQVHAKMASGDGVLVHMCSDFLVYQIKQIDLYLFATELQQITEDVIANRCKPDFVSIVSYF